MSDIPIISMWQPWAQWVSLEWKTIESRLHDRFKSLEGRRIGIHASLKWDSNWLMAASEFLTYEQRNRTLEFKRILHPAVICTAMVSSYGRLTPTESKWALIECVTPRFGLWLRDVELLDLPIQCKGRQGIFYVQQTSQRETK